MGDAFISVNRFHYFANTVAHLSDITMKPTQPEFGFTMLTFNLAHEAGVDGARIVAERAQSEADRKRAEAQQTDIEDTTRAVYFNGPESDRDSEGEEVPVWSVYVGNADADPVGKVYWCHSLEDGRRLAQRMADEKHLELVDEGRPA